MRQVAHLLLYTSPSEFQWVTQFYGRRMFHFKYLLYILYIIFLFSLHDILSVELYRHNQWGNKMGDI